jgi:hypothetical protein
MSPSLLLTLAVVSASPKAAEGARIDYLRNPGAESCADENSLRQAVAAHLGYDPFRADAQRILIVRVDKTPHGWSASLELHDAKGALLGERHLDSSGSDCSELSSALALALSIAIDPLVLSRPKKSTPTPEVPTQVTPVKPPSTPTSTSTSAPTTPSSPTFFPFADLGLDGSLGDTPSWAFGAWVGVGLRWADVSLGLEVHATLPSRQAAEGGWVVASLLEATAVPCWHRSYFGVCSLLSAGTLEGKGEELMGARSVSSPYVALGARLQVAVPREARFAAAVHLDLMVPVVRTTLFVGNEPVWTLSPVALSLGLEGLSFFWWADTKAADPMTDRAGQIQYTH